MTVTVQIRDLFARRDDLKRDLAAVEVAIERCHHDWVHPGERLRRPCRRLGARHVPGLSEVRHRQRAPRRHAARAARGVAAAGEI
jgi:hypothetical protein